MPLHSHQPGLGGDRVSPFFWVSPGGLILAPTPGATHYGEIGAGTT